ncbi:hypothetical protein [Paenibacillus segetis]|uniref:Uncharacterized protein n=1 Tax=Paenibacillus segetis TaxID=1325360 RepID=A0ABQ1YLH1_9BACL|nr:hypothetical protein [Paenibacillus segetis]GGH28524.1 hypothetical protein GCM10008013_30600 [Paenibacillus segetis]
MVESWIKKNYLTGMLDVVGECIVWGSSDMYYGIYTPIDKFEKMFGAVIQNALDTGSDVKQAIRDSDADNTKGFNDIL